MSDIVSFGPFLLRTDWLVFLLSGVGGYVFLNGRLAECLTYREKIKDILLGAAFIYLIAWKVSPAIFSPSLIIDNPLGILYFPVGNRGVVLAILITCIYTGFRLYREKIPFVMFANSSVFLFSMAGFIFYLFQRVEGRQVTWGWINKLNYSGSVYHPIHLYQIFCFLLLILWVYIQRKPLRESYYFRNFLIWFGLGQLAISLVSKQSKLLFGLSTEQWVFFVFVLTGLILEIFLWKRTIFKES